MANQKEYNEPFSVEEQGETDPKEDDPVDPFNDEPDESESIPHDDPTPEISEDKEESKDASEKSDSSLPKRGARFRKQLLKKIPIIKYPDTLETKELALDSWLGTIINLKAPDYLEILQRLVSRKNI
jgi:hypothetical protein